MPGLAIVLEARAFASAVRIEAKAFAGREGLDGEHVPDIERDDVGDKNVNVVGGVNHLALPVDRVDGLDVVTAGAHDCGALELDAPKATVDGVVVEIVFVRVVVVRIVAMRVVVMRVVLVRIKAVRIENEVVALAIAPGFGNAKAQAGGLEQEGGLGEFSFALGVDALDLARRLSRGGAG
jgi:hypothetical protein